MINQDSPLTTPTSTIPRRPRTGPVLDSFAVLWLLGTVACSGNDFGDCSATHTCDDDATLGEAGAAAEHDASNDEDSRSTDAHGGSGGGGASGESRRAGGAAGAPEDGGEPCGGACPSAACCDGECVDLDSDVQACGACGHVCEFDDAGASCRGGECVMSDCRDGHVDCNHDPDDGCETPDPGNPATPVLLAPMIGAYSGSLQARAVVDSLKPAFSWQPVEVGACDSVSYQLQVDDDCDPVDYAECDFPEPEVDEADLTEARFVLDRDLPVDEAPPVGRRYYWRVRACDLLQRCSDWSPTRYLDVGRIKEDLNGDGYAELVVHVDNDVGIAYGGPYFGDGGQIQLSRLALVSNTERERVRFLGDVNGDGFADLGVTSGHAEGQREVLVFLGGSSPGSPIHIAPERDSGGVAHPTLTPIGDFDHDGLADFLIGVAWSTSEPDWVAFYRGQRDLSNGTAPERLWEADASGYVSGYAQQSAAGDYNGDGYPDFALGVPADNALELMLGGPLPDFEPDARLAYPGSSPEVPCSVHGGLVSFDMNGDGLSDLAALCDGGRASIYFGRSELSAVADWTFDSNAWDLAAGDIDGDGFDDLFVSGISVYRGDVMPVPLSGSASFEGDNDAHEQRLTIADHNGDGFPDIAIGNQWYRGDGTFAERTPVTLLNVEGDASGESSFTSFAR